MDQNKKKTEICGDPNCGPEKDEKTKRKSPRFWIPLFQDTKFKEVALNK